jgi:hypothetical protein
MLLNKAKGNFVAAGVSRKFFLYGFITLFILWVLSHFAFLIVEAVASDGCTKCPFDTYERRWEHINFFNFMYLYRLGVDLLLLYGAYFVYNKHMIFLYKTVDVGALVIRLYVFIYLL